MLVPSEVGKVLMSGKLHRSGGGQTCPPRNDAKLPCTAGVGPRYVPDALMVRRCVENVSVVES